VSLTRRQARVALALMPYLPPESAAARLGEVLQVLDQAAFSGINPLPGLTEALCRIGYGVSVPADKMDMCIAAVVAAYSKQEGIV
jgi:hypothetical protein